MTKYIHYGNTKFDSNLFTNIKNNAMRTKPEGGFWASRIDADYGWKDWCNDTEFKVCEEDNKFVFTLSPDAKVLYINSVDDLINLPKLENKYTDWTILDFEKIAKEYDAIEVNIDSSLYYALYTWDCDSILIMNPNIIRDTNF